MLSATLGEGGEEAGNMPLETSCLSYSWRVSDPICTSSGPCELEGAMGTWNSPPSARYFYKCSRPEGEINCSKSYILLILLLRAEASMILLSSMSEELLVSKHGITFSALQGQLSKTMPVQACKFYK